MLAVPAVLLPAPVMPPVALGGVPVLVVPVPIVSVVPVPIVPDVPVPIVPVLMVPEVPGLMVPEVSVPIVPPVDEPGVEVEPRLEALPCEERPRPRERLEVVVPVWPVPVVLLIVPVVLLWPPAMLPLPDIVPVVPLDPVVWAPASAGTARAAAAKRNIRIVSLL